MRTHSGPTACLPLTNAPLSRRSAVHAPRYLERNDQPASRLQACPVDGDRPQPVSENPTRRGGGLKLLPEAHLASAGAHRKPVTVMREQHVLEGVRVAVRARETPLIRRLAGKGRGIVREYELVEDLN